MKLFDQPFKSPEENLACDEALLEMCENGAEGEILRLWEPEDYFAVLGYSNKANEELCLEKCQKDEIPVLRRTSGGGTVLQGPGCLNYSLILKIESRPGLRNLKQTNCFIMKEQQKALRDLLDAEVKGDSDLTLLNVKFSGNAQRRKRRYLLFHGTFLYDFKIEKIRKYLSIPKRQPIYRENRAHGSFLTNVSATRSELEAALKKSWGSDGGIIQIPENEIHQLVQEKYSRDEWNFKF